MNESKIALTERLRRERRWEAASAARDQVRRELRASGATRAAANDAAWEAMAERFAPLSAAQPSPAAEPVVDEPAPDGPAFQPAPADLPVVFDDTTFSQAVQSLPNRAAKAVEMDWVAAHPAMSRLARAVDKTRDVRLTADDILNAPHGPAPSKWAANALQNWVNKPGKFFEVMLSEDKKLKEEQGKGRMRKDVGIAEVERILAQIRQKAKDV